MMMDDVTCMLLHVPRVFAKSYDVTSSRGFALLHYFYRMDVVLSDSV
jgi:hypothetical protein